MLENVVSASNVLRRIPALDRPGVLSRFKESIHASGDVIIEEEKSSAGLFLLVSGEVGISKKEQGDTLVLATLVPGDFFGEISLVLRRPAVATVKAMSDVACLLLPRDDFLATIDAHPEILTELYQTALKREEETASILAREAEDADDLILL
jgi:CRP-like cAMP-binding protein